MDVDSLKIILYSVLQMLHLLFIAINRKSSIIVA